MADKKITELPEATVLNDSDLLTIVQGGVNKKVTGINTFGSEANIIYIRSNGNDAFNGLTKRNAVATLPVAETKANALLPVEASRVQIKSDDDGLYTLATPLYLRSYIDCDLKNGRIEGILGTDAASTSDHYIHLKAIIGEFDFQSTQRIELTVDGEIYGRTDNDVITNYASGLVLHSGEVAANGTGVAYIGKTESQFFGHVDARWTGDIILEAGSTNNTTYHAYINGNCLANVNAADKSKVKLIINGDYNGNITTTGTGIVEMLCWQRTGGIDTGNNISVKELKDLSGTAFHLETTSWIDGELIVPDTDPTKYIFKQNTFLFKDFTSPYGVKIVPLLEQAAKTPDNIETTNVTYISVNSLGNILESPFIPDIEDQANQNEKVFMAAIVHQDHSSPPTEIDSITNAPIINANTFVSDIMIYLRNLGAINLTLDILSPNGANLHLNKAQGWQVGAPGSFGTSPTTSFVTSFPPQSDFFMYRLAFYNNDPNQFFFDKAQDAFAKEGTPTAYGVYNDITASDEAGALIEASAAAPYFILRFFQFPIVDTPNIGMQYAQATYASLSAAKSAYLANTDPFIENGFTSQNPNFTFIGALITRRDATNLTADLAGGLAEFLPGAKLKGISGGAGASAIAYIPPDQTNKLYVNKVGNDSNNGKSIEKAFLTPDAAYIAAAAASRSATNRIVVAITDDGYYSSTNLIFNHNYIDLSAPYATLDGGAGQTISIQSGVTEDNFIHVKRLQNDAAVSTLGKTNDATGTTHLNIGSVYNAGNGIAVSLVAPCEGIIGNISSEKTDNTSIRLSQATSDDYYCLYLQNVEGNVLMEGNPKGSVIIGRQNGGSIIQAVGGSDAVVQDLASMPEKNIVYFQKDGYTAASNVQGRFLNEAVDLPQTSIAIANTKTPTVNNHIACTCADAAYYVGFDLSSIPYVDVFAPSAEVKGTTGVQVGDHNNITLNAIDADTTAVVKTGTGLSTLNISRITGVTGIQVSGGELIANVKEIGVSGDAIYVKTGAKLILNADRGNGVLHVESGATAILSINDTSNFTYNFESGSTIIWKELISSSRRTLTASYNPSALTSDYLLALTSTAFPFTITISTEDIQSATPTAPRFFVIKDESGGAATNNITIEGETGNIDGQASIAIIGNFDSITIYSDGTNLWSM